MPDYSITSFHKGVVDSDVLSKLDQQYRNKLLTGDNVMITRKNTLKTRPDFKESAEQLENVIDAIQYKGETVYLQKWEGSFNINRVDRRFFRTRVDLSGFPPEIIAARDEYVGTGNIHSSAKTPVVREIDYELAKIGGKISIVKLTEKGTLSRERLVSAIYILNAQNTVTQSYFTDSDIAIRLNERYSLIASGGTVLLPLNTQPFFNEGSWLVSNKDYLPSKMVYNHVDDTLLLNMLGDIWVYNGENLRIGKGLPTNITSDEGTRLQEDTEELENIPLIAQIWSNVSTRAASRKVRGTLEEITDQLDDTDANEIIMKRALPRLRERMKLCLTEVDPSITNDTFFSTKVSGLQGEIRYIFPDIKAIEVGSDAFDNSVLYSEGDRANRKSVITADPVAMGSPLFTSQDQRNPSETQSLLSRTVTQTKDDDNFITINNTDRKRFTNTAFPKGGYTNACSEGVLVILQEGGDRDNNNINAFGETNTATGTSANINPALRDFKNLTAVKLTVDYSHPRVVEYMNKLETVSLFASNGRREFISSVAINLERDKSSSVTAAFAAISPITVTAARQAYLKSDLPTKSYIWRMLSSEPFKPIQVNFSILGAANYNMAFGTGASANVFLKEFYRWLSQTAATSAYTPAQGYNKLHRYSASFQRYKSLTPDSQLGIINNRSILTEGQTISFSKFSIPNEYNSAIVNFVMNNLLISSDPDYLRLSGAPANVTTDVENNPQSFNLLDEQVTNISLLDVRSNNEGVITTDKRVLRVSGNGAGQVPVLTEIDDFGVNKGALTKYTSSLIHSQDGLIHQSSFYERLRGFVTDMVNDETDLPKVIDMIQLIGKHKTVLILHEHEDTSEVQQISALALGSETQIKGLTKWYLPEVVKTPEVLNDDGTVKTKRILETITKLVKLSEDEFLMVGDKTYEVDMREEGTTGMDGTTPIKWTITPTPIRFNTERSVSVMKPLSIDAIAIGVYGDPKFKVLLQNRIRPDETTQELALARDFSGTGNIADMEDNKPYSGMVIVKGIPPNSGELPTLTIEGEGIVTTITGIDIRLRGV